MNSFGSTNIIKIIKSIRKIFGNTKNEYYNINMISPVNETSDFGIFFSIMSTTTIYKCENRLSCIEYLIVHNIYCQYKNIQKFIAMMRELENKIKSLDENSPIFISFLFSFSWKKIVTVCWIGEKFFFFSNFHSMQSNVWH